MTNRELDAWIAVNIMENKVPLIWEPTKDIKAAWEVVEKMGLDFTINWRDIGDGRKFYSMFLGATCYENYADTAPKAICLAAKKALEVKE